MQVKALFWEQKAWPTLTPGDHKQFHLCASGGLQAIQDGIWATALQGETPTTQDTEKDHCPGHRIKDVAAFIWLTFSLNSIPLTYTFLLLIKSVNLKWNLRRSVRVCNPLSSQIASHLNKVPIKIESLSLLIGSGSDKQHECRLFWFHIHNSNMEA